MILFLLACDVPPAECGSERRPFTDPTCQCMDYARSLDSYPYMLSCRPDQTLRVEWPGGNTVASTTGHLSDATAKDGDPVAVCTCKATP